MKRVHNFSAGPSIMPESVLKTASSEMLNYNMSGQSVMEMSHRSKIFKSIINDTETLLRELMNIPKNYKVLFLQGGASSQFAMVPLNLMNKNNKADFIITGNWANKAYKEASKYGKTNIVASSEDKNFSYIPTTKKQDFNKDADFVHICINNTIYGTKFTYIPDTDDIPIVCDASSFILSEPIDISRFGVFYAGAQKNMGPAGLTIVIIREDLIGNEMTYTPTMFNYKIHAENKSLYNTPPCYSIYMCKLVLEWLKHEIGGLENMKSLNIKKANLIYDFLDNSKLFKGTAKKDNRSLMNIPFITSDATIDEKFINYAQDNNITNIKGHRSVGGMRASIYNAMPIESIKTLIEVMEKFEKENL